MTAIVKYVDTAATGTDSGDDWTNAYPAKSNLGTYLGTKDLVTDTDTLTVYFRGGADASTLNGASARNIQSNATYWCKFVMDGTNGSDETTSTALDTAKYHSVTSTSNGFYVGTGYLEIHGLQFLCTGTTNSRYGIFTSVTELVVDRCILKSTNTSTTGNNAFTLGGAGTTTITNCIMSGFLTTGISGFSTATDPNLLAFNNTIVACGTGVSTGFQNADVTNCLFVSNTANFSGTFYGTGGATDYNGYEDGTDAAPGGGTNTNNVADTAVALENEGSEDFRLASGDTAFHAAGIGTTNSNVPATDFFGVARGSSTCSIGACEYVAAATGRSMGSLAGAGGLAGPSGLAGTGGGIAG